ncbi:MAG: dockerin type I domain-containing protein [Myxococcota bacterium]|jgi:hypothetical protein|nr:dockerin type I domain-containing protein [Myxococcota bacterium]
MFRRTTILLATLGLILSAPAALAAAGDCNGDGAVDGADLDALVAANNTLSEGTSLANCDYDGDGAISLADVNAHLAASN